jgi:late competence protein required for DNA uptake (superfamily II DNA/RNA helicase)
MPCNECNSQFTIFKRKTKCQECKRLFCTNCLSKKNGKILCSKCLIFLKRPLSKVELNSLKIKDLIFYLQSKHISTTGCVGKFNNHPQKLNQFVIAFLNFQKKKNSSIWWLRQHRRPINRIPDPKRQRQIVTLIMQTPLSR